MAALFGYDARGAPFRLKNAHLQTFVPAVELERGERPILQVLLQSLDMLFTYGQLFSLLMGPSTLHAAAAPR